MIVFDAPLLKSLTSASVNLPLETPVIHLVYNEDRIISFLYIFILIFMYIIKREALTTEVNNVLVLMLHVQIIQKKGNTKI